MCPAANASSSLVRDASHSGAKTRYGRLWASRSRSLRPSPTPQPSALRPAPPPPRRRGTAHASTAALARGLGSCSLLPGAGAGAGAARTPRPGGRRGAAGAPGAGPLGPLNLPGLLRGPQPETAPRGAEQDAAAAAGRSGEVRTGPLRVPGPRGIQWGGSRPRLPGGSVRPRGRGPGWASCANSPHPGAPAVRWLPARGRRSPGARTRPQALLGAAVWTALTAAPPPAWALRRGSGTPSPDVTAPPECLGARVAFGGARVAFGDPRWRPEGVHVLAWAQPQMRAL